MNKNIIAGIVAVAAMASAAPAFAGTASGTLTSTLSVTTSCSIGNGGSAALDFGSIPAKTLTAPLDADTGATLTINCDGDATSPTLAIGASSNLVGGVRALKATVGAVTRLVPYAVFQDAGRTTPFAIDTPVAIPAFTAGANTVPVYGRIATGTVIDQGSYSDTVSLTVTY